MTSPGPSAPSSLPDRLRESCAKIAAGSRYVAVDQTAIGPYAASLAPVPALSGPPAAPAGAARERAAALWLTLDAINFGSGWFPTLRKRPGMSGYRTIAAGLSERFDRLGPWSAEELRSLGACDLAQVLGQDPRHELIGLFVDSLRDLGERLCASYGGSFLGPLEAAGTSALALVGELSGWECFADCSRYDGLAVPFFKRAQITAADLHRAGVACFSDLDRLTMFADNLVPHVLRLDGVLRFSDALAARIEAGELLEHDSPEEVEMRACAVQAVELIVAALPGSCAAAVDQLLWERGSSSRYKAVPRPRCRCTAY
jgi:hypothetical protein